MLRQISKDVKSLNVWCLVAFGLWSFFQLVVLVFYDESERKIVAILGEEHGRAALQKDITYRAWNAKHGGVYVPVTDASPPNPYLNTPDKVIEANNQQFTLINPAYMTRQVHKLGQEMFNTQGHLTSLNVVRAENKAEPWEVTALKAFEGGASIYSKMVTLEGKSFLRVMLPLYTDKACLKCHASHGYREGDIRGGISTIVSLEKVIAAIEVNSKKNNLFHIITYFLGLAGLATFYTQSRKQLLRREKMERKVVESEETARSLLNASSDAAFLIDKDGTFLTMNDMVAERLKKRPEDLLGISCFDLLPADLAASRRKATMKAVDSKAPLRVVDEREGAILDTNIYPIIGQNEEVQRIAVFSRDITKEKKIEKEREKLIAELQVALDEITILREILPICASCKKIRDDKGYWNQIEAYLHEHADLKFSHSICPDCMKEQHPEIYKRLKQDGKI